MRLIRVPAWFLKPEQKYPHFTAIVRQVLSTLTEAETAAAKLGVSAIYGDSLPIANLVNEALLAVQERNLPLPLSVIVQEASFRHLGEEIRSAVAMGENGVLVINPRADYWLDPVSYTRAAYEARIWSTPHPLHPIFHEMGHLLQEDRGTRGKTLTAREHTEIQAVSYRARAGIDEAVAEIFAGLLSGVTYDREILRIYTRYGGIRP